MTCRIDQERGNATLLGTHARPVRSAPPEAGNTGIGNTLLTRMFTTRAKASFSNPLRGLIRYL